MRSFNVHIKLNPYIQWNDTMRKFAKYFNITYYQSNLTPLQDCVWKITNNKLIISGNLSSFSLSKVYYCLDADIYLESKEDEELELCCAGLGRKKYEKYFKPISLLDFDTTVPNEAVPANISKDDIDSSVIREIK